MSPGKLIDALDLSSFERFLQIIATSGSWCGTPGFKISLNDNSVSPWLPREIVSLFFPMPRPFERGLDVYGLAVQGKLRELLRRPDVTR
jgi:hypothetical protein